MTLSAPSQFRNITLFRAQYGPATTTILHFAVNLNRAPDQVVLVSPEEDAIFLSNPRPLLTWYVPNDYENNPLDFEVQIDVSDTFNSQIGGLPAISKKSHENYDGFSFTSPVPAGVGEATFQPTVDLIDRTLYYWRVRAYDGKRYGEWSVPRHFTIGVIATSIKIEADRTYLPVANTVANITASFVDRLNNVDTTVNEAVIFVQTQPLIGTLNPVSTVAVNGIASTGFTSSGVLGATYVEVVSILPHNILVLRSMNMGEIPQLVAPTNGIRLPSETRPRLTWMVPDDPQGDLLHFKVEIFSAENLSPSSLVYLAESRIDVTGFSYTAPVPPLTPLAWHDVQDDLPDGRYWWRITPYDVIYKAPSEVWTFSMPNQMTVISKPLVSEKPITQAVVMANVTAEIGTEEIPARIRHYVTNMALEHEQDIIWEEVTDKVQERVKHVFANKERPPHGWAIAVKTVIEANETVGAISLNGHGVVFDGDYHGTSNDDYVGVMSILTPIGFYAAPTGTGNQIALNWAYVDSNTSTRRIIDKFIIEVYNDETGQYEPYDGGSGEVTA